ncbi:MAG TPA: hypothetical protein VF407_04310 [Polyangiaceae bacterium]
MARKVTASFSKLRPARLDELLEFAPAEGSIEEMVLWLVKLVEWIRPIEGQRIATKMKFVERQLANNEPWRANVARVISRVVAELDLLRFFAHAGIPSHFHLGGAVGEWMLARALPTPCKTDDATDVLRLLFREDDLGWIRHPSVIVTLGLLLDDEGKERVLQNTSEASLDLAHQIVAQAHSPSIRVLQTSDRSPFTGLYEAIASFHDSPTDEHAYRKAIGRIHQCELLRHSHGGELVERGASLNTTFQLRRLQSQLERLRLLTTALHDPSLAVAAHTFGAIVFDVLENASGKRLFRRSADLVVQNVVDSAADVGRNYLDDDHSSWGAAFSAGAGGGLLMVIATIVKYRLASLELPDLYEGFVFSLNYASAFVAAYLLHWTIATKLPAHTAATLARSTQEGGGHRARLRRFAEVWRAALRLQIAGLVGNLAVAAPGAWAVAYALRRWAKIDLMSAEQAHHALTMNSVLGPSFAYAALTGLFLWSSSLIGALGTNAFRVVHLADRLATNPFVLRRFRADRARPLAEAVVDRAGGVLGNAALGFMLGGIPALFAIAHLPVEIRHITVSTSSVAMAVAEGASTPKLLGLALAGLAVIAFTNVAISFALALWLSLRATRGLQAGPSSRAIAWVAMRWWRSRRRTKRLPAEGDADDVVPVRAAATSTNRS